MWTVSVLGLALLFLPASGLAAVDTLWARAYGPHSSILFGGDLLAVDSHGNVYVVGTTVSSWDGSTAYITTLKYDAQGALLWARQDSIPGYHWNMGAAVTVDSNGTVYCAGWAGHNADNLDLALFVCDSSGSLLRATTYIAGFNQYAELHMRTDADGFVYIVGAQFFKISPVGELVWSRPVDGITFLLDVDESGNSLISGSNYAVKYNSKGDLLWKQHLGEGLTGEVYPEDAAVDPDGNLYYSCWSSDYPRPGLHLIEKLDPSGESVWRFTNTDTVGVTSLCLDKAGDIILGGGTRDCTVAKYSPDGQLVWSQFYDGPAHSTDWGLDVGTDSSGIIYVCAQGYGIDTDVDYVLLRYAASGGLLAVDRYDDPLHGDDRPRGFWVSLRGRSYMTGNSSWPAHQGGISTVCFDEHISPPQLDVAIHQNPILTNYFKAYLAIDEPILTDPLFWLDGAPVLATRNSRSDQLLYEFDFSETMEHTFQFRALLTDLAGIVHEDLDSASVLPMDGGKASTAFVALEQNVPNPFNSATEIRFTIAGEEDVHLRLDIYDILGQLRATLADNLFAPGQYNVAWNGRSSNGSTVASGVYLCRMSTPDGALTRKLLLLR